MNKERRIPAQSRSREKYEKLLSSARELIGNKGNDSVSMREISKHSGVALASIYQYFPDKNAILKAIMDKVFIQVRETLETALSDCDSIEMLIARMHHGIDEFHAMFKQDPVLTILWAGLQANPHLVALDTQDSMQNAKLITDKVCELLQEQDPQTIYSSTLLIVHMTGSTIRLAHTLGETEGEQLIVSLKDLVTLRLSSLN